MQLENLLFKKLAKFLLVFSLFVVSCKKDSDETIRPLSKQYLHVKTEAYDINNIKIGEVFLPYDSNGTYFYFSNLFLQCVVICDANSASLPHNFCLLPSQMDSTYFPFTVSSPVWSFTSTEDTIKGIISNPGDSIYFPNIDRFEYYLVKSNYLPADSTKCN